MLLIIHAQLAEPQSSCGFQTAVCTLLMLSSLRVRLAVLAAELELPDPVFTTRLLTWVSEFPAVPSWLSRP
jgi:hypothetical protein